MNFTREPIIETIITPKEGYKLVIRNTKGTGQEEFFVDSVQVISMGHNCFYRSLEKPKPFVVPALDYEVLEVRETKMVLKMPSAEKGGIKIGGGREAPLKAKPEAREEEIEEEKESAVEAQGTAGQPVAERGERRRDRRRMRRQKDRFEKEEPTEKADISSVGGEEKKSESFREREEKPNLIIPPPNTLISETIARYKDIPGFASAFFEKVEEDQVSIIEEERTSEEKPEETALTNVEDESL